MGGERASSVRRRREGKICCSCGSNLPPPHTFGERYCVRCLEAKAPPRRVYMHFMLVNGWYPLPDGQLEARALIEGDNGALLMATIYPGNVSTLSELLREGQISASR